MGAVDKVALGTAAILGIRTDLGLVGQEYSWCSSLIFFGQLATVFPALFVMQKYATGKVVAVNVMIWGECRVISARANLLTIQVLSQCVSLHAVTTLVSPSADL
jgi:hypothetical protein